MRSSASREKARKPQETSWKRSPLSSQTIRATQRFPQRLIAGIRGTSSRRRKREAVTMWASPATIGATSGAMSAGSNWPSPSMFTTTSAPMASAVRTPLRKVRPRPRLTGWLDTRAPASRASSAVRSVEPSSITSTSTLPMPGMSRGTPATTSVTVRSSLRQGTITTRRAALRASDGTSETLCGSARASAETGCSGDATAHGA